MRLLVSLFSTVLVAKTYASYLDFGIPASTATVDVKVFHVANATGVNGTQDFILPILPGHDSATFPMHAFIVQHNGKSQTRLMFDLGIRKDPENFVPSVASYFSSGAFVVPPHKDIVELLQDGGINLTSIDAVIWRRVAQSLCRCPPIDVVFPDSHTHFDHVGDMSKFPNTTRLVVSAASDTSTYPTFANASLQESDFAGHNLTKVDFSTAKLTFSGLKAIDYFGDGSFYLLDTPGHMLGHMTGLARVTPTSFIVLGGDTFHHGGQARPQPHFQKNYPCPAHLLEESKSAISTDYFWSPGSRDGDFDLRTRAQPLLTISDLPTSFYADPAQADVSLDKVSTFDADPDFFVIVAHDASLTSAIPLFPASISDWKKRHLKESVVWNFVDAANPAFMFSPVNSTL
ncbi:Metallo-beta-lactamase superfamily protein [Mycena sanguinolenta]|uniref:Metallo-beta-lactamase superfamily protein n=1 Tax=Mycena sanguinolenta TaxID=230812 RepID=A0A8H6YIJ0_9AGAR|nr:Metallo-beta-lactamase superfamily protein [Mycena sanguinolenta]